MAVDEDEGAEVIDASAGQGQGQDGQEFEDRGDIPTDDGGEGGEGAPAGGEGGEGGQGAPAGDGDGGDGQGQDDDDRSGQMIPKSRFDEVNNERKWLREQVAQLRGGQNREAEQPPKEEPPEPFDFDKAEEQYMDALFDGDREKAKAIRREINQENQKEAEQRATSNAQRTMTESQQQQALQKAAADAISNYPFLDSNSDQADKEAINDVVNLRDLYRSRGMTDAEALSKAADVVGSQKKPVTQQEKNDAQDLAKTRTTEARRRNAEASNRIPPSSGGIGDRSGGEQEVDVAKMTEEEFANLSDAEKKRLRGD